MSCKLWDQSYLSILQLGDIQFRLDNNRIIRIHIFVVVKCSTNHAGARISIKIIPCTVYWSYFSFNWPEFIQWGRGGFDPWDWSQPNGTRVLCLCCRSSRYWPIQYPCNVQVVRITTGKSTLFQSLNFIQFMMSCSSSLNSCLDYIVQLFLKI